MRRPTLYVICGLPGSGKTTLGRRLAAEYGAIRLSPDEWLADLELDVWDEAQRGRLERRMVDLACEQLGHGVSVVLDWGVWLRRERDALLDRGHSAGARVELHHLEVPFDERWRRIEHRNRLGDRGSVVITREQLAAMDPDFEAPDAAEMACFDPPHGL